MCLFKASHLPGRRRTCFCVAPDSWVRIVDVLIGAYKPHKVRLLLLLTVYSGQKMKHISTIFGLLSRCWYLPVSNSIRNPSHLLPNECSAIYTMPFSPCTYFTKSEGVSTFLVVGIQSFINIDSNPDPSTNTFSLPKLHSAKPRPCAKVSGYRCNSINNQIATQTWSQVHHREPKKHPNTLVDANKQAKMRSAGLRRTRHRGACVSNTLVGQSSQEIG